MPEEIRTIGTLYMLPVPLGEASIHTIPEQVQMLTCDIKHFFVEQTRTARRYLKRLDKSINIDQIQFSEVNTQTSADLNLLTKWLQAGHDVGMMSEAGCAGVADPGSVLAAKAHQLQAKVVPLTGPSSVLLALMASGFNGQGFRFVGYLPVKEPGRSKTIKELEQVATTKNEAQIFIETPYRNNQLLQEILRHCNAKTQLCIACNLTESNEYIKTQNIAQWRNTKIDLHKQPCIFLLS